MRNLFFLLFVLLVAGPVFAQSQQIMPYYPLMPEIYPGACESCPDIKIPDMPEKWFIAANFSAIRELRMDLKEIYNVDLWRTYMYMKSVAEKKSNIEVTARHNVRKSLNALYIWTDPEEKDKMRLVWAKTFGIDLWYPYFQAKKIEKRIKEKLSFKIFKMKCSPKFQKGSFIYTCIKKF